jgi:hypothetical protein
VFESHPLRHFLYLAKLYHALDLLPPREAQRDCCDDTKETITAYYMTE